MAGIVADAAQADDIADLLTDCADPAAQAVACFDIGEGRREITAYYGSEPDAGRIARLVEARLPTGRTLREVRVARVPQEDWVATSQRRLGPVRAGGFLIHGGHDRARCGWFRAAIEIDAGQAFGTAHHGTTRGCLMMLDSFARRRSIGRVCDLGTGTGVLAIAAAKRGARHVVGSDNDPLAVGIARANARLNGMGGRIGILRAQGLDHPRLRGAGQFDLVVANILARPLWDLAPGLARAVVAGGGAILSGITGRQAPALEARYRAFGFAMRRRIVIEDWATLRLVRRARQ